MNNYTYGGHGDRELVPGTLRGYRAWNIGFSDDGPFRPGLVGLWDLLRMSGPPRLLGSYSPDPWRVERTAKCEVDVMPVSFWRGGHPGPAPEPACTCGIYALYSPYGLHYATATRSLRVDGVIAGSGRILMGSLGFRAEHARIVALTLPKTLASLTRRRSILAAYPGVELFGDRRSMYDAFPVEDLTALGVPMQHIPDEIVSKGLMV